LAPLRTELAPDPGVAGTCEERKGGQAENGVLLLAKAHLLLRTNATAAPRKGCTQRDLRPGPLDAEHLRGARCDGAEIATESDGVKAK
jgi:hypothetical protein